MSKSPASNIEIDETTSPANAASRSTLRKWLLPMLIGSNLLMVTIIACWLFLTREASHPDAAITAVAAPPVDVMRTIGRGDELQLAGKLELAMEQYHLAAAAGSSSATALAYRMAVVAENLGQWDRALEYFNSAADQTGSELALAARLGQARVYFRKGNLPLSFELLARLATTSATPAYAATEIGPDIDFLMALVKAATSLDNLPRSKLDVGHVFQFEVSYPTDHLLRLVPLEANRLDGGGPLGDGLRPGLELVGSPTKPTTTLISASFIDEPVSVVLDSLAAATSWKISLSETAREVVGAKPVRVHARDTTAGELLSLMLEPLQLFWTFEFDTLVIESVEHIPREVVALREHERADQLLQHALAATPDHLLAPQAYLAQGNLALLAGRGDRAATFYREVIDRFPGHSIVQTGRFNLAKLRYADGDLAAASEALYQVVDQRRGSELEPLAYLYLGRLHFEQGDAKRAKAELSRSHGLAIEPPIAATAALSLAGIYLLDRHNVGAPGSATQVLMERRELLRQDPFRAKAAFLSGLSRFRAAVGDNDRRRTGRELIAAVLKVDPESFFGDFGYLLVGEAFSELNLGAEAVRHYQAALGASISKTAREEISFRLAMAYRRQGEDRLAKETLLELSSSPSPTWAPQAAVELADLLLQSGELRACAEHCRWALLQPNQELHRIELLRLLGRVYEQLGDHENASICFAGFLPSDEPILIEAKR